MRPGVVADLVAALGHRRAFGGQLSMVKPGVNQVALMPRSFRNFRMRPDATRPPNSPRDSGVGVVMPRAMKPDWVSKSKVRQTMWRGNCIRNDASWHSECVGPSITRQRNMAIRTIGIILNGATGRICSTQHLANALAPIRDEGGLPSAPTASCRG